MARSRRVGQGAPATVTISSASPESTGENGDGPDAQTTDALSTSAGEGQKSPRARITRWNEGMRQYATLDHVSAEAVDEQWVQNEYGGGKYRVYFWGTMRDGSYGYLPGAGKEFVIDDSIPFKGALKHRAATGPVHNADGTPAGNPAPGASLVDMGMLQLFTTMQENSRMAAAMQADHSKAMMAMMQQMVQPRGGNIAETIVALSPLLGPVLAGLLNRKDPVELATQIAALSKSEKSGLGNLHELIELKDALAVLGGNGDSEEGGWMRIFEKVLPGAVEILKNESQKTGRPMTELARQPAPARIAAPAAAPLPPSTLTAPGASSAGVPSASSEPQPVTDEWTGLEPHMNTLANFAANAKDPYDVVKMVKVIAPAQVWAAIRELVSQDNATEILIARFPVLAPYRSWTDDLLGAFHEEIYPEQYGDGEELPPVEDTHLEDGEPA